MGKKVLHFKATGNIGGAERALYQLVKSQIKCSEFEPAVAFSKATGYFYEKIGKTGCEVIDLDIKKDWFFLRALKIKKDIEKYKIHHFHSLEVTPILASMMCKGVTRIFTQRSGADKYKFKKLIKYKVFGRFFLKKFHGLSGNTNHACSEGAKLFCVPLSKWRTTYNGVVFEEFEPEREKAEVLKEFFIGNDSFIIGSSSHLRPWKRVDLLLKAFVKIKKTDSFVLIIGDGPDKRRLEGIANSLGISDKVIFAGMKEDINNYLQLMDVFVLPSNSAESFGNSVVEAMSLGIPGIVFEDGGGITEHIQNGKSGYIVKNINELSDKLSFLMEHKDCRSGLGANARKSVRQKYTLKEMSKSYDLLYLNSL